MVFAIAAAAMIPQLVSAHLLNGSKGHVDAFNYGESQLKHLDSDCAASFECRPNDIKGVYFYNCHYDVYSSECQCSEGELSKCSAGRSSLGAAAVATGGIGGVFGTVKATVKAAFGLFDSLPTLAKVAILAIVAVAVMFAFSRLRNTASNNLRRARELHEQAALLHESGDEEEAKLLLERSNYNREKAYEQMRQQNPQSR